MSPTVGLITSLVGAFVGAYVAYYFTIRQLTIQRRFDMLEKQLIEFYSPAAAIAQNLRLRHDLGADIWSAYGEAGQQPHPDAPLTERVQATIDSARAVVKYAKYDQQRWKGELLPEYRKLLDLFTKHYWLADTDTRALYPALLRYLEIHDRLDTEVLPPEVATHLGHHMTSQRPLFEHLEAKVDHLRRKLLQT